MKSISHLDVCVPFFYERVDLILFFLLFHRFTSLFFWGLRRSKRIRSTSSEQDMTGMNLFFRLAVFVLSPFFFELDDMKSKLTFDDIANLAGLEGKSSFLKFRYHLSMAEPTKISTFILAARIA